MLDEMTVSSQQHQRPASPLSTIPGGSPYGDDPWPAIGRGAVHLEDLVLSTVHELALDGILVVGADGRVLSYNQRFATMWGIAADLLGTESDKILLQAVTDKIAAPQSFLAGVNYLYAHQEETSRDEVVLTDGRIFDRYSAPIHLGDQYFGRVWYFRDDTERRRTEAALRDSEQELRVALAAARMGTFDWDLVANRVVWSRGSETLFGFRGGAFGGTHEAFERCVHPQDLSGLRRAVARCIATRAPFAAEFRVVWPDGSEHWVAGQGDFTFDDSGQAVRLRGIGLDVTARKQSEEQLRQSMENTVAALAATCETRDPYTAGHQRRVADLAVAIARELGLDEMRVHSIYLASILHDIGKIKIPVEILTSPRALSPVEIQLVQTHVEAGYQILKGIEFPWPIAEFVRQHHERLDGSGYPQGLKGPDIPVEARIIAVADTVEAMAGNRPYRFGRGVETTLEELESNRDILYDSNVVDACLTLFRSKRFVLSE